jgi:hypothetical protein
MLNTLIYKAKIVRSLFVSDKQYLKKRFIKKLGYVPDFNEPKTFNEKVTARMIYDRCPFYTVLADKHAVRDLVANRIGTQYLVPLLGVHHYFEDIKFDLLPQQFVLKCTHESGSAVICKKKDTLDMPHVKKKMNRSLSMNMYYRKREWHYKNITPKIMIEKYVELYVDQITQSTITTCRVHCFQGKPKFIEVDITGADGIEYSNIYNTLWELQSFTVDGKKNTPLDVKEPVEFVKMLELAEQLCFKYGYSRIDFLLTKDTVYFSEITLTQNAGRMVIEPKQWDETLGLLW